jgi:hypothetical protein
MVPMNFFNLTERERTKAIYRIASQDRIISLFRNRQNSIGQPSKWKDKFENFQLALGGTLDGEPFDYSFRDHFLGQCWHTDAYSEAMWGIYANDADKRYLRIKSTPEKLLKALIKAHPLASQDTCFIGKVQYLGEKAIKEFASVLELSAARFAQSLLMKRRAFKHESEVRLLYFSDGTSIANGFHSYDIDPHEMITQIMADPSRPRGKQWTADLAMLRRETGFKGEIKRSKLYDAPSWAPIAFTSSSGSGG